MAHSMGYIVLVHGDSYAEVLIYGTLSRVYQRNHNFRGRESVRLHAFNNFFFEPSSLSVSRGEFLGFLMLDNESLIEARSGKREVERVKWTCED